MGTITNIAAVNTLFDVPQTVDTGAQSFTAGRNIWVVVVGTSNFHAGGLDGEWSITDDASTNNPTWTQRGISSVVDSVDPDFRIQAIVWSSDEIGTNETFTITVDAESDDTTSFYYSLLCVEFEGGNGQLAQSAAFTIQETEPGTVTFGSTPGSHQLILAAAVLGPDVVWDSAPSGWSTVSGSTDTDGGAPLTALESTTNTSTGTSYGLDEDPTYLALLALEFSEGTEVNAGAATATGAANAATVDTEGSVTAGVATATATTNGIDASVDAGALVAAATADAGDVTAQHVIYTFAEVATATADGNDATNVTDPLGIVFLAQGEVAMLGGTWSTATASSLRLFTNDVGIGLTAAQRNALTESDFTEASFTGYSAGSLTSGSWTITPGTPTIASYIDVVFTSTAIPGAPVTIIGYYITRDSDGDAILYEKFEAPQRPVITDNGDQVTIGLSIEMR